ncbi:hypothetical protein E2562_028865 [Oryza meyeriana var. granulata]|uniref:Uncharacterized protein n=1 Tax=Oryza meyeriana var. granulata TaxID=110450 RepID=A0A6G1FDC6_9ORYZ|nr:hypothetical protein E2562_028865 [Oryza meyeriana var. granulata]
MAEPLPQIHSDAASSLRCPSAYHKNRILSSDRAEDPGGADADLEASENHVLQGDQFFAEEAQEGEDLFVDEEF